jgi:O-methyltransferase domain
MIGTTLVRSQSLEIDVAMAGGRVLLVGMVVPDTDAMYLGKVLDLNMLVMNGGRERTKALSFVHCSILPITSSPE